MIRLSRMFYLFISRLMETFIASILLSIVIYFIAIRIFLAKHPELLMVRNISYFTSAFLFIALYIVTSIMILQSVMKLSVFIYLNIGSYFIYTLISIIVYLVISFFFPKNGVLYTCLFMPTLSLYPSGFKGLPSIITFHFIMMAVILLTGYIGNRIFNRMLQKTRHLNIDEF